MTNNCLEHINLTVSNPDKTAALLAAIFDWQVRWAGDSMDGGRTVHVGRDGEGKSYLALYTHARLREDPGRDHHSVANLNHIGIVVTDLDKFEQQVIARGIKTFNHGEYEPGRRFYFYIDDAIEVEAISYT